MQQETEKKPLFRDINADEADPETTEIESLCMNCGKNGITRLLLTKIPFYKEVVIMSFNCDECGYQNNEIQPGGTIGEKGINITLNVISEQDMNRQVVKSDYTSVKIPELEFEVPSQSQKGEVTTIEGIVDRSISGLEQDQSTRKLLHPDDALKIEDFIMKLKELKLVQKPFKMVFEDISGNTFVQNPSAPHKDPGTDVTYFTRTKDQDHILGIYTTDEVSTDAGLLKPINPDEYPYEDFHGEVLQFPTNCSHCGSPCDTNMKVTKIPYFKEVVIMATVCDCCGHKTNEVKSGGGIEPLGIKIEVKVRSKEDFSRDVLKSETCSLSIPELQVEVGSYALGGRFSTVEGILSAMREQLVEGAGVFGDSADLTSKQKLEIVLNDLELVLKGEKIVTLVLDDPAGNSYVQSLTSPDPDDGLIINRYERSHDQNEDLGLNDMKTEDYEES